MTPLTIFGPPVVHGSVGCLDLDIVPAMPNRLTLSQAVQSDYTFCPRCARTLGGPVVWPGYILAGQS